MTEAEANSLCVKGPNVQSRVMDHQNSRKRKKPKEGGKSRGDIREQLPVRPLLQLHLEA